MKACDTIQRSRRSIGRLATAFVHPECGASTIAEPQQRNLSAAEAVPDSSDASASFLVRLASKPHSDEIVSNRPHASTRTVTIFTMPFETRDAQTRIKHSILKEYAGAFLSIIGGGYRRYVGEGNRPVVQFAYVDGFAGYGRYARDTDTSQPSEPIWGSPIIAMRAFELAARPIREAGVTVELSAVVVEENPAVFEELIANIEAAGLSTPHRLCNGISDAQYGYINLIRADFRDLIQQLIVWLGRRYTLALVDPFGTGMPMEALGPLLSRERTDAIVLFPFMDVSRKGASVRKAVELRTPGDNGNITRAAAVFGNPAWEAIARDTTLTVERQERAYEELYYRCLEDLDPELIIKNIPLRLSSAHRTVYHLFLTTRDPDGALRMNAILRAAGLREHFALWADYFERRRHAEEQRGEIDMFAGALDVAPAAAEPEEIDREELKRVILDRCPSGTVVTVKQMRRRMANDLYLEGEINSALAALKREGRVQYGNLRKVTEVITFV